MLTLKTLVSPVTTATSAGVAFRYLATIISSLLTIVSLIGWLTPDQVEEIGDKVRLITAELPELFTAVMALIPIVITIYATLTKSSSNKAAAVAKAIDKAIPAAETVFVKTPAGTPDIVVHGK